MPTNIEVAEQLFTTLSAGDIDAAKALCAEDMSISQNGGAAAGFASVAANTVAIRRIASNWRYENAVRVATSNGFVEEHDACGTLADGTEVRVHACIVAVMVEGLVSTMHEYLDTRSAGARALAAAFTKH